MKAGDLQITEMQGGYSVKVCGRANFDYAVPLRDLAGRLPEGEVWVEIDLENCEAMDSTFMGVLTMLALKMQKRGKQVTLVNVSAFLRKLLSDLGVSKLFKFIAGSAMTQQLGGVIPQKNSDMLKAAETVAEAHRALVDADPENKARFDQVIHFADQDVERLKKEQSVKE